MTWGGGQWVHIGFLFVRLCTQAKFDFVMGRVSCWRFIIYSSLSLIVVFHPVRRIQLKNKTKLQAQTVITYEEEEEEEEGILEVSKKVYF